MIFLEGMPVRLTLGSLTALHIIRAIRCGKIKVGLARRCAMLPPDPGPMHRWTRKRIAEQLAFLGTAGEFSPTRPLDVLVPEKDLRLQVAGTKSTVVSGALPKGSFVDVGNGIAVSCPELLFIELARAMDPIDHVLVGMELCGCFSRAAENPRNGDAVYGIAPVTTVAKLRAYAREAHEVRGSRQALAAIDLIAENAWSPAEALVAALAVLLVDKLGLDLGPIDLNPRKELGERLSRLSDAGSRVPDIMFRGTNVGLNYDGEDHFRLSEIARAAVALDRDPGNAALAREFAEAMADSRARIVADKRRDRDLMLLGLTVFSITKEDLLDRGGFERAMGQVVEAIERAGRHDLLAQRVALGNERISRARHGLICSLMPGLRGKRGIVDARELGISLAEAVVRFEEEDGDPRIVSVASD
ncbi:hypothetical protein EII22_01760 [Coriobacteriales bacterium OH1046]|nr:hypothetical protein EII22_01760 [Coriobacteriales bacterium OH1046]